MLNFKKAFISLSFNNFSINFCFSFRLICQFKLSWINFWNLNSGNFELIDLEEIFVKKLFKFLSQEIQEKTKMRSWIIINEIRCYFYLTAFARIISATCPISSDIPPPVCAFLFTDNECIGRFSTVTEDSQEMELDQLVITNSLSFFLHEI